MIPIWKLSGRLGNQMFQLAYLKAQELDGLIPDIYVQGEEYFDSQKGTIKRMFSDGITPINQVSIHVRRGDYVTTHKNFYTNLFREGYYERAMDLFPGADFLVFSDDIPWCKEQAVFADCDFSEGNDEVTDLNLMAGCEHNIIANSSFSWWAAYLNPNPNKKVIAPKHWFLDDIERVTIPDSWKRI